MSCFPAQISGLGVREGAGEVWRVIYLSVAQEGGSEAMLVIWRNMRTLNQGEGMEFDI